MEPLRIIGIIIMSGLITLTLRALPFIIFKGTNRLPRPVKELGSCLPPSIMAVLVVYCLKDVRTELVTKGVWELLAVMIVALSYKWKHNTFFSILLGTACYMAFLRCFG